MAKRLRPILAVFRKSDGKFMDSEDSYARGATPAQLIDGANVIGIHGGTVEDYICVPVDEKDVHLFRYVDQMLVPDLEALTEIVDREDQDKVKKDRSDILKEKLKNRTLTLDEIQEFLANHFEL